MTAMIPDQGASSATPDAVTIARIEGKIDRVLDRVEDLHGDSKDHEDRLRSIEASYVTRAMVTGWFTALILVISAGIGVVALVVK